MAFDTAIAIHPCGYQDAQNLCPATKARVRIAVQLAQGWDIRDIIITGGVYFDKKVSEPKMLAYLVKEYFLEISGELGKKINFYLRTDCYNSSTDIKAILDEARKENGQFLVAISSFWHLWALRPLYRYWRKKLGYQGGILHPVSPSTTDVGIKTLVTYVVYALVIRAALAFGFFPAFDRWLNQKQAGRVDHFPVSGCD